MRELTKSTLSAGLAMSLFGMQMVVSALRKPPAGAANPAQDAVDTVTQALVDNTNGVLREAFQSGDKVQRTMVDLTFRFLTLAPLRSAGSPQSKLTDVARQATDRIRTWMDDMSGAGQPGCGCGGAAQSGAGNTSAPAQPPVTPTSAMSWGRTPERT